MKIRIMLIVGIFTSSVAYGLDPSLFDGSEVEVTQTTNAPPKNPDAPIPEDVKTGSSEDQEAETKANSSMTNTTQQVQRPEVATDAEPEAPVLEPLQRRTDIPETDPKEDTAPTNAPPAMDLEKFIPSENISSDAAVAFPVDI